MVEYRFMDCEGEGIFCSDEMFCMLIRRYGLYRCLYMLKLDKL